MSRLQALVDERLPDRINTLRLVGADNVAIWSASDVDPGTMFLLARRPCG